MSSQKISGGGDGFTLTMLGCGTMGTGILGGILSSLRETEAAKGSPGAQIGTAPPRLPSRFIACVRSARSEKQIQDALRQPGSDSTLNVDIYRNDNAKGCKEGDIIILGCKPYMVGAILGADGMAEALEGKVLISICAGVSVEQLEASLYSGREDYTAKSKCTMVRAMLNTASAIRESMTVIATSVPELPESTTKIITWMFEQCGQVVYLPANMMDVSTSLCGSGLGFFLLMLEAAADGGVAMGLPRAEAIKMAAQTMKGAAGMVLTGEHPAVLKDKVTTPGGCTIGGLLVLEEGAVRGTIAKAVREATVVASQLGKGVQGVNGTRH